MLISPPFLPQRADNATDDEWLDTAMPTDPQGHGKYPLSFNLGWHGGVHLQAPQGNDGQRLPVRAIADGTVVYMRGPDTPEGSPQHALNYGDVEGNPVWTSNGCVVIRHTTEIGVDLAGQATTVTFFSVYMHLNAIRTTVQQNRPIYRKAEIGDAGYIYGQPNLLHFEIICDDVNLQRLVGRIAGDLSIAQNGRTDVVFGRVHFHLPIGAAIYSQRPAANVVQPTTQPVHTTTEELLVALRYTEGEGIAGNHGDAYLQTYRLDGTLIGNALEENDAEYSLYTEANHIVTSYRDANAPQVPSPSTVYELLRFGRVIGPDVLTPADTPHWRQIRYGSGQGWVNLNADNVHKFSDADFPHWMGWKLADDSFDQDSRCDSAIIRGMLDGNNDGRVTLQEATNRMQESASQKKLARIIAKYPTEWEAASIDSRWGWLKTSTPENPEPLTEEDFGRLRSHLEALCFWQQANIGIPAAHWHFHPTEFVRQFRQCIWISTSELRRIFPGATEVSRQRYGIHVAQACRKYLISSNLRLSHFFGQSAVESGQLAWMSEMYNGNPYDYFRRYERARNYLGWLGNIQWDDGGTYRGRGFKQMTGRANYAEYWTYRGWLDASSYNANWWRNVGWWGIQGNYVNAQHQNLLPTQNAQAVAQLMAQLRPPIINQPERAQTEPATCIDTAGWFWAKNRLISIADQDDPVRMTNRVRGDNAAGPADFPPAAHFQERQGHTNRIINLLGE